MIGYVYAYAFSLILTNPGPGSFVRRIPLYIPYNSPLFTMHTNPPHTCSPCRFEHFCSVVGSYMTIVEGHAVKSYFISEGLGLSHAWVQHVTLISSRLDTTPPPGPSKHSLRDQTVQQRFLGTIACDYRTMFRYGHTRIRAIRTGYQSSRCGTFCA